MLLMAGGTKKYFTVIEPLIIKGGWYVKFNAAIAAI
jgi:hypothetical protein